MCVVIALTFKVFLVSAILRAITQVLDTKAVEGTNSVPVEQREDVHENPVTEELDITDVFKLEAGIDDDNQNDDNNEKNGGEKFPNTRIKGDLECTKREVKTSVKEVNFEEPGEIIARSDDDGYHDEEMEENPSLSEIPNESSESDLTKTKISKEIVFSENEQKERVLSENEQNYIMSSLARSAPLISQLETARGQILNCHVCAFSTGEKQQRRELRIHVENVHFICKLCGNFHLSQSDLKHHMVLNHIKGSKYFLCGIGGCRQKQNTAWKRGEVKFKYINLYRHVRKQHCKLKYSCDICKMQFKSVKSLRAHVSLQHNGGKSRCPQCFKYARNLQKHKDLVHMPKKCTTCNFVTHSFGKLRKHVKVVHQREPQKCSSCHFETKSPVALRKHIDNHHTDMICSYCSYKAKKKGHIWRHELTHSDVAGYKCDMCDFKTKTPQSLKVHRLYHSDTPKYVCDQCDYTSFNSANFCTHKKTKHGPGSNEHKCDLCGDAFQYLRHLVRHKASHKAAKFDCKMCKKQFSRKDKLREHGRKEHVLDEQNENEVKVLSKSVSCPECGKLFTESKHLSRHKASVHEGLAFHCIHCQKSFSRKDKMNSHINFSCKLKLLSGASGV